MIRQAHTYLLGAMSGTALIAAAVVVFVVLVSAQAFKDWPLSALGGGGDESVTVSPNKPVAHGQSGATIASPATARHQAKAGRGGSQGGSAPAQGVTPSAGSVSPTSGSTDAPSGGDSSPPESTPAPAGSTGGGSSAGGSSGGASGSTGSGLPNPSTSSSPSSEVTGTVNNTVPGASNTLGGALEGTGVTEATEGIVNGAAGPESVVGQTVNETVETVEGLLTPHR